MIYCLHHGGNRNELVSVRVWCFHGYHVLLLPCATDRQGRESVVGIGDTAGPSKQDVFIVGVGKANDEPACSLLRVFQLLLLRGAERGGPHCRRHI